MGRGLSDLQKRILEFAKDWEKGSQWHFKRELIRHLYAFPEYPFTGSGHWDYSRVSHRKVAVACASAHRAVKSLFDRGLLGMEKYPTEIFGRPSMAARVCLTEEGCKAIDYQRAAREKFITDRKAVKKGDS